MKKHLWLACIALISATPAFAGASSENQIDPRALEGPEGQGAHSTDPNVERGATSPGPSGPDKSKTGNIDSKGQSTGSGSSSTGAGTGASGSSTGAGSGSGSSTGSGSTGAASGSAGSGSSSGMDKEPMDSGSGSSR